VPLSLRRYRETGRPDTGRPPVVSRTRTEIVTARCPGAAPRPIPGSGPHDVVEGGVAVAEQRGEKREHVFSFVGSIGVKQMSVRLREEFYRRAFSTPYQFAIRR
jgi:hypothetical protein